MPIHTNKTKSKKFWVKLILANILIILLVAGIRTLWHIKMELIPDMREVVIGLQKAPTTIKDWYYVTYAPEKLNPDAITKEILQPFIDNYQDYENSSYQIREDGGVFYVNRDGDEACGVVGGHIFYAQQTGKLADIYVLREGRWFHYQKESSAIFFDFKHIAELIPTLTFPNLPRGYASYDDGYVFYRYLNSKENPRLLFTVSHCGHVHEIGGCVEIQSMGEVQVGIRKLVDFDNLVEIENLESVLNPDEALHLSVERGFFPLDELSASEIISTVREAAIDNINLQYSAYLHRKNLYTKFSGGARGFNNEIVSLQYPDLEYYDGHENSTRYDYRSPYIHSEITITLKDDAMAVAVFDEIVSLYSETIQGPELIERDNVKYWHAKVEDCDMKHAFDGSTEEASEIQQLLGENCIIVVLEKVEEGYKLTWKDALDNPIYVGPSLWG